MGLKSVLVTEALALALALVALACGWLLSVALICCWLGFIGFSCSWLASSALACSWLGPVAGTDELQVQRRPHIPPPRPKLVNSRTEFSKTVS